jgi:hypothetical protein
VHEPIFARSILSDPPVILRLRMQPYSIGHEILLWFSNSPLILLTEKQFETLDTPEKQGILSIAALICSRDWSSQKKAHRFIKLWSFFNRKLVINREVEAWRAYRDVAHEDLPAKQMPRVNGATYHYFGAPEISRLLLFVQPIYRDCGFKTPFDFPLALAKILYSTASESDGKIWIKNFQDYENDERLKAFERENPGGTFAMGVEAIRKLAADWNQKHPDAKIPAWMAGEKEGA